MECSHYAAVSSAQARAFLACGAELVRLCARCGKALRPDAHSRLDCGAGVARPEAILPGWSTHSNMLSETPQLWGASLTLKTRWRCEHCQESDNSPVGPRRF